MVPRSMSCECKRTQSFVAHSSKTGLSLHPGISESKWLREQLAAILRNMQLGYCDLTISVPLWGSLVRHGSRIDVGRWRAPGLP